MNKKVFILSATLVLLTRLCFSESPSYTPISYGCEIRYHFRETIPDAAPGEKDVTAQAHETEMLPASQVIIKRNVAERVVHGRVKHLPYVFFIRLKRISDKDRGLLEVNVINPVSGKSLEGFPKKLKNAIAQIEGRVDFEIPISKKQRDEIKKSMLSKESFITYVNIVIGSDIESEK